MTKTSPTNACKTRKMECNAQQSVDPDRVQPVQSHFTLAVVHVSSECRVWLEPLFSCSSESQWVTVSTTPTLPSPAAEFQEEGKGEEE